MLGCSVIHSPTPEWSACVGAKASDDIEDARRQLQHCIEEGHSQPSEPAASWCAHRDEGPEAATALKQTSSRCPLCFGSPEQKPASSTALHPVVEGQPAQIRDIMCHLGRLSDGGQLQAGHAGVLAGLEHRGVACRERRRHLPHCLRSTQLAVTAAVGGRAHAAIEWPMRKEDQQHEKHGSFQSFLVLVN